MSRDEHHSSEIAFDAITLEEVRGWIVDRLVHDFDSEPSSMPIVTDEQCWDLMHDMYWMFRDYITDAVVGEYYYRHDPLSHKADKTLIYEDGHGKRHKVILAWEYHDRNKFLSIQMLTPNDDGTLSFLRDVTTDLSMTYEGQLMQSSQEAFVDGDSEEGLLSFLAEHGLADGRAFSCPRGVRRYYLRSFTDHFFEMSVEAADVAERMRQGQGTGHIAKPGIRKTR